MLHPGDEVAIEALGDLLLPSMLMDQVRTHFMSSGFLAGLKAFARYNKRAPDAKKAWRFIYAVENLKAIYRSHRTLRGLVTAVLSQGVGAYRNPLEAEEVSARLTDPAKYPGAADLAEQLRRVRTSGGRIWIPARQGLELALRGMLVRAGFTLLSTGDGPPGPGDLVLASPAEGSLALLLFKALQLEESREWEESHHDFVAFDLETTDKDTRSCEIVEIGAARVRNGVIVETFRSLVHCQRPISPRATEIHGFRDADLVGAPGFAEVWGRFRDFVGDDILVAHNGLTFDVPVLLRMAAGLPGSRGLVFYDSLPLARSLSSLSARLEDLATLYGVETGRSHHAEDDAVALAQVYLHLNRTRVERARKAALTNLLDDLGLALALEAPAGSPEVNLFRDLSRTHTLGRFGESLDHYARERTAGDPSLDEVIERLGGQGLMDRLRAERRPEDRYPGVMARLETLIAASESPDLPAAVESLLDRVALSSSDVEVERDRVNLLTLHATKGLEFSRVYVIGVEDNEMPGNQALANHRLEEIEEARRLLYVGMTRAKDRLILTRAAMRRGGPAGGSTFLEEIGLTAGAGGADVLPATPQGVPLDEHPMG
jgi:DNA polymerase III epsilon subunit family exonuclease